MAKLFKKILVVEDNPVTQEFCKVILKNAGYTTEAAFSAQECLPKAKAFSPDVILMDVILPDGDGKEIARQLQSDPQTKDIPVIFVTNMISVREDKGYETFEIDGRIYRAFAKPVHGPKLLSVIRKEYNMHRYGGQPTPKLRVSNKDKQ